MQGTPVITYSFRPSLIIRLITACWLITKLICYKLWLADRLFPLVPVHDSLLNVPNYVHIFFLAVTLLSLIALLVFPAKRWLAIVIIVSEFASCLFDQNRWQPWEYQFLFMLLPFVFTRDENRLKTCWQVIAVGLYFFSGLSKLNQKFIMQGWNGMILRDWIGYTIHNTWMFRLGYLMPLIEMGAALALFFNRSRKIGVVLLCIMHGFILLMFGPAGLNINIVLWPWNMLMPFLLLLLFYDQPVNYLVLKPKHPLLWFTIFCWWILPWLNLFGYLDDFFSGKLYSGKTQYLFICTSNPHTKKIFADYFAPSSTSSVCDSSISVFKWGIQEMKVPPNPELRVYKQIVRQWEQKYDTASADKFLISNPGFSKEKWVILYDEK